MADMYDYNYDYLAQLTADPQPDGCLAFGWMQLLHGSSFKTWNCKIYGRKCYYHYYIHNVVYWMSDAQAAEIKAWYTALYAWVLRNNITLYDPYLWAVKIITDSNFRLSHSGLDSQQDNISDPLAHDTA